MTTTPPAVPMTVDGGEPTQSDRGRVASSRRSLLAISAVVVAILTIGALLLVSSRGSTPGDLYPTLVGDSVWVEPGENYAAAIGRLDATLGRSQVLRIYYPGRPEPWPGAAGSANRAVVVSFKADPSQVSSGSLDPVLAAWFAQAPRDHVVYWSYYHEPEDNIANGEFTAAQYRAAWTHLRALADAADNPQLKSTLILMSWSLEKSSGRDWRDYYPGAQVIDVLGWDAYNEGASPKKPAGSRSYYDPADVYGASVAVSNAEGKPFGFAEWGSLLVPGDDGTGRAAWMRDSIRYMAENGALFATYFDAPVGLGDYRLHDTPSRQAMNDAIAGLGGP